MSSRPPEVRISDFHYELPSDRIAAFPLAERDASRLLVCRADDGTIDHRRFRDLPDLIPPDALLVLNDTRVVRARLLMRKRTGGRVELLLLEPVAPSADPAVAMGARGEATWRCMVGGARRARGGRELVLDLGGGQELLATIDQDAPSDESGFLVHMRWPLDLSFAEVLMRAGRVPLPPYIHRDPVPSDAETYQTVYARLEGSVAAPTAGLHFTPNVLSRLEEKGVEIERVTLHVGAGTFKPVTAPDAATHQMHHERIAVPVRVVQHLAAHALRRRAGGAPFVIVGTTSVRTVESLYWFGVKLAAGYEADELEVDQWDPYRLVENVRALPDCAEAFDAVGAWAVERGLDTVTGITRIMIVPGYSFAACDALVTNFHQPESTLILLVGALLGRELWRRVYDEALKEGYRFLSYGDSSLLIRDEDRMRISKGS